MMQEEFKKSFWESFSLSKMRQNPWILTTIFLALILIISLVSNGGSLGGGSVSKSEAGDKLTSFAAAQGLVLDNLVVTDMGSFYQATFSVDGQDSGAYITKDGEYLIQPQAPLTASVVDSKTPAQEDIPKTDKPKVELYVWGYCPYGVAAQGPMAEVAKLLKGSADFMIIPYYDGHGAYETQQNKIQLCVQKYAADKYWDYAAKFVEDVYPACSSTRTEACDKTESLKVMNSLGIDSTKVMSCVSTEGVALFAAAAQKAQEAGVQGSPTVRINGLTVSLQRNAEAYKAAVCAAFNKEPTACSGTVSTTTSAASTAAASGNCGA